MVTTENGHHKFWYAYNKYGILRDLITEDDIKVIDKHMEDTFVYEVAKMAKQRANDKIYENLAIINKEDNDDDCI